MPLPSTQRLPQGVEIDRYNTYDNAILYTDHVVGQIIEAARGAGESASVTFLSDHGEALGEVSDFHSHMDGSVPCQVYEVPLTIWVSPTLRDRLGAQADQLRANLNRPYRTDSIIHTLLDLYGVDHAERVVERSLLARVADSRTLLRYPALRPARCRVPRRAAVSLIGPCSR